MYPPTVHARQLTSQIPDQSTIQPRYVTYRVSVQHNYVIPRPPNSLENCLHLFSLCDDVFWIYVSEVGQVIPTAEMVSSSCETHFETRFNKANRKKQRRPSGEMRTYIYWQALFSITFFPFVIIVRRLTTAKAAMKNNSDIRS